MTCADLEILLCDYVDGALSSSAKAEVDQHLAKCAACAEMARDASAAVEFMERAEAVEPPPELLTRILFELPSWRQTRARPARGLRRSLRQWFQPILQPRFAMGFAMTILSFSLLGRLVGISPKELTLDDLRPAKIVQALDDKIYRGWQRTVKFYESLRFVYEIQTQLREWTQKDKEERAARTGVEEQQQPAAERPAETQGTQGQGTGGAQPRNQK